VYSSKVSAKEAVFYVVKQAPWSKTCCFFFGGFAGIPKNPKAKAAEEKLNSFIPYF
jgi:hypothetical protein